MNTQDALNNLNSYLNSTNTTIEDWDVSEYKGALIFSVKAPARSNALYIVKNAQVKSFAPSTQTIEEAYSELV